MVTQNKSDVVFNTYDAFVEYVMGINSNTLVYFDVFPTRTARSAVRAEMSIPTLREVARSAFGDGYRVMAIKPNYPDETRQPAFVAITRESPGWFASEIRS